MKEFVTANRHVGWSAAEGAAVYGLIEGVLQAHHYRRLSKGQKGIVRSFLAKVTGLSRAQVTRLIPAVDRDTPHREEAGAASKFPAAVYAQRYRHAGRGGCRSRGPVGAGGAAFVSAGMGSICGEEVPAASGDFGVAPSKITGLERAWVPGRGVAIQLDNPTFGVQPLAGGAAPLEPWGSVRSPFQRSERHRVAPSI